VDTAQDRKATERGSSRGNTALAAGLTSHVNLTATEVALLQYYLHKLHLIIHGVPVAEIYSLEAPRWKV
jgi:hypothetical protein